MGQKINPIALRLGIIRGWDSNWYGGKDYGDKLVEDEKIRKYLQVRIPKGGISKVVIERTLKRITLTIHTSRPGIVIGKGAEKLMQSAKKLRKSLVRMFKSTSVRSNVQSWMLVWWERISPSRLKIVFHTRELLRIRFKVL